MKFAIPTAEGKLTAHFGHSQEFVLLHVEENRITKKEVLTPPPHEPGVLPRWLHDLGTDVIIAGGMGQRAARVVFPEQHPGHHRCAVSGPRRSRGTVFEKFAGNRLERLRSLKKSVKGTSG